MKAPGFSIAILFASLSASAQQAPPPCTSPESREFDFWLGEWDLTYTNEGKVQHSRNRITKILDGCVILEEFTGAPGIALDGRSFSMYDTLTKKWKQTWVDNNGTYLDFNAAIFDGNKAFVREVEKEGKRIAQRMLFTNVTPASLKWLWQRSDDGGKTWSTQWEIDYKRIK